MTAIYGRALLKRGLAAFDELKQGIRDIEFLADPTKGDVRIGCPDSIAGAILAPMVQKFCRDYPGIVLNRTRADTHAGAAGAACAKIGCGAGAAVEAPSG